ncbi:hypothetical protein BHM03_00003112 [Ensete ventricosum]|nr:hypothetical protein BHM03_00003112 [Ensete ventricosum]
MRSTRSPARASSQQWLVLQSAVADRCWVMGVGLVSEAMEALRHSVHGFPHAKSGQAHAVCAAARAAGALERRLRKQASCADSDTSGSTAQLWWAVNEREEET